MRAPFLLKKFLKNFKKSIDKSAKVCYTKHVRKGRKTLKNQKGKDNDN